MRKIVLLGLVACLAPVLAWYFLANSRPSTTTPPPAGEAVAPVAEAGMPPMTPVSRGQGLASRTTAAPDAAESADGPVAPPPPTAPLSSPVVQALTASNPEDPRPAALLEAMRSMFRQYSSVLGGNPIGTNPEITRALNGENSKQITFIKPDAGMRINGQGELVDSWGTPFFFHQLSAMEMEIRSAGPDRKMWTGDDLVTK